MDDTTEQHSAQEVVDALAYFIYEELRKRDIEILESYKDSILRTPNQSFWGVGIKDSNDSDLYQVPLATPYNTPWRAQKDLPSMVGPWAIELAIKLARPFPIRFHTLEIPRHVHEGVLGQHKEVIVRLVTDYTVQTDQLVTRFDTLVKWTED